MAMIGGAVAQFPAGWLADKFDRRHVLIGASLLSVLVCGATALSTDVSPGGAMLMSFLFGVATIPIFSISAAHANDFADADFMAELSADLMFFYGVGAIFSPLLASALIQAYGPGAMFGMIAVAHVGLVVFGLYRMTVRDARTKAPYTYIPRTSFILGRVLRRRDARKNR